MCAHMLTCWLVRCVYVWYSVQMDPIISVLTVCGNLLTLALFLKNVVILDRGLSTLNSFLSMISFNKYLENPFAHLNLKSNITVLIFSFTFYSLALSGSLYHLAKHK